MALDREAAKELRRKFKDEVKDELERFVNVAEGTHGDTLKYWLAFDTVEEVWGEFVNYLKLRKRGTNDSD